MISLRNIRANFPTLGVNDMMGTGGLSSKIEQPTTLGEDLSRERVLGQTSRGSLTGIASSSGRIHSRATKRVPRKSLIKGHDDAESLEN